MMVKDFEFRGLPFKVACCEDYPDHPTWYSFVDEQDVRLRNWGVAPGQVCLDVGASFGSYTAAALASGAAHVYSWCPEGVPNGPREADTLHETLALNGWEGRCTIFVNGVYDRDGWFTTNENRFDAEEPPNRGPNTIPVRTLDSFHREHALARADWMKLDVEGAEVEVLRGGEKLIRELRPRILVENHVFVRATIADEVRALLESWGYRHVSTVPYHTVSHSLYEPV